MPRKTTPTFLPGDRVRYSRGFLKSICEAPGGALEQLRGVVQEVKPYPTEGKKEPHRARLVIRWNDGQTSVGLASNFTPAK